MTKVVVMMRTMSALFFAALAFSWTGGLYAQTSTATLSGTVHDPSNAVVVKAVVTLTNSSTGISRKVESDSQGRYSFSAIEPGRYELSVRSPRRSAVESRYRRAICMSMPSTRARYRAI
jgi:hypothetical protein